MLANWSRPSNTSGHLHSHYCRDSHVSISTTAFLTTRVIMVNPLALWVLCQAQRRWRRRRRSLEHMSHSEIITYHMALMQLSETPGLVLFLLGYVDPSLTVVGFSVSSLTVVGEILLHVLTCVERYLAVVHPIAYLKTKTASGVAIRGVCVGGVWLSALAWAALIRLYYPAIPTMELFCFSGLSFTVVSFCSLSVLCVLVRPRPGGADGDRADQSKKRAFKTIMTITAALWLWFSSLFPWR